MTTTLPDAKKLGREWVIFDAKEQILGKLASRVAIVLRGKHKAIYTPFLDTGDFVVVINAGKIAVSGQKLMQKNYQRYSGYPGGQRNKILSKMLETKPETAIRLAVKGMMPDGPLGRKQLKKLKIYPGEAHPHKAQQPKTVTVKGV